jgi:NTP pyrophosphatase (non-canonical NTP hydrolase)
VQIDEYQDAAYETAIYPDEVAVAYTALGLTNEAGEVAGKVKKVYRDNEGRFEPAVNAGIAKELGDVLWYLACLAKELGYSLDYIAQQNLDKLADRAARNVLGGSGDDR